MPIINHVPYTPNKWKTISINISDEMWNICNFILLFPIIIHRIYGCTPNAKRYNVDMVHPFVNREFDYYFTMNEAHTVPNQGNINHLVKAIESKHKAWNVSVHRFFIIINLFLNRILNSKSQSSNVQIVMHCALCTLSNLFMADN